MADFDRQSWQIDGRFSHPWVQEKRENQKYEIRNKNKNPKTKPPPPPYLALAGPEKVEGLPVGQLGKVLVVDLDDLVAGHQAPVLFGRPLLVHLVDVHAALRSALLLSDSW